MILLLQFTGLCNILMGGKIYKVDSTTHWPTLHNDVLVSKAFDKGFIVHTLFCVQKCVGSVPEAWFKVLDLLETDAVPFFTRVVILHKYKNDFYQRAFGTSSKYIFLAYFSLNIIQESKNKKSFYLDIFSEF